MALTAGTRLGSYEIVSRLGVGGMGEVYRARDTRLKRDVALKVLPDSFAADPERLARFQREAEVLASLNHTNIAAIHGIEEANATTALVMELVEGPTLADRIAQGPLPIDETLAIARQIAEALEAAHEQGIVHRDVKPANVKVRDDGTVKVLDFGLAKLASAVGASSTEKGALLSNSPTVTSPALMTGIGTLLGTAAYMSPEQARGRPADRRSDIWAFGCVLYEMLTGQRAFEDDDVSLTLSRVLRVDPEFTALPSETPPTVRQVVRLCLKREPAERIQAAGDVRLMLQGAFEVQAPAGTSTVSKTNLWGRNRAALVGLISLVAGAAASAFVLRELMTPEPGLPTRFTVSFPGGEISPVGAPRVDVSSDGRIIVYGGRGLLYRRDFGDLAEEPLLGTEGGTDPNISPSGQWIVFGRTPGDLFKIPASGGTLIPIVKGPARGASWARDDSLVLGWIRGGLSRVSANGGEPVGITTLKTGEIGHRWPDVLPGGDAVLFTVWNGTIDKSQVAVASMSGGEHRILAEGVYGRYSPSGHLVFARGESLWTVPFDAERLQVSGTPVPVIPDIPVTEDGAVPMAISTAGTLVYDAANAAPPRRTLVWVDRQGRETAIPAPQRTYLYPRISPDGSRIAVTGDDGERDLWVWDVTRGTQMRATFGPGRDLFPLWTPDGRTIVFGSEVEGPRNLFRRTADGTGDVERLSESQYSQNPTSITEDGRFVIFTEQTPDGGDIKQIELQGHANPDPSPRPRGAPIATTPIRTLVQSPFIERNAALSPDGRWLAYEGNESGRFEVYVRPYPEVDNGRWQVSTDGGMRPVWARNGRELFFTAPSGSVMYVGVERSAAWIATTPSVAVKEGYVTNPSGNFGRMFDVAPDGQRFVMIREGDVPPGPVPPASVVVIQNWGDELKRLSPMGR